MSKTITIEKGILKRGDTYLVHVHRKGKRRTATVSTLQEARDRKILIEAELIKGKDQTSKFRGGDWTLEYASTKCLATVWKGLSSERNMEVMVGQVEKYFGKLTKLVDIDPEAIDQWVSFLEDAKNSNATINRKLSCLGKILRVAHERGVIDKLPKMPKKKEGKGRLRFFTEEEETEILSLFKRLGKDDHHDFVKIGRAHV